MLAQKYWFCLLPTTAHNIGPEPKLAELSIQHLAVYNMLTLLRKPGEGYREDLGTQSPGSLTPIGSRYRPPWWSGRDSNGAIKTLMGRFSQKFYLLYGVVGGSGQ